MKLRRLILQRYGHLADVTLEFPETPGLALVLGANEAGKSTALAAIGDALFGFEHRTDYAFQYATSDLRIGVDLQAADGRRALFWRRKGNKDTLRDENDNVVPDSAIAAFLGNATREKFEITFGLNGTRLRAGGRSILEQPGDAASTIISAFAGGRDYRAIIKTLDDKAKTLFGDGRGEREFFVASNRFSEAKRRVRDIQVDPGVYTGKCAERDRLTAAQQQARAEITELSAKREKLERIRRTTPIRRRLDTARASLAAIGPIPDLPEDAGEILEAATSARNQAERDRDREAAAIEAATAAIAALPARDPVLDEAETIGRLGDDRARIAAALTDRANQTRTAEHQAEIIRREGAALGLTGSAADLAGSVPTLLDRQGIDAALRALETEQTRYEGLADRVAEATRTHKECESQVSALAEPPPNAALDAAIDCARAEGALDDTIASAHARRASTRAALDQALATLPHWQADAEALARLPVPLDPEIDRLARDLEKAKSERDQAQAALHQIDEKIAALDADIAAASATGELPTDAVITQARARRDTAWSLIRRAYLASGTPITDAERADTGLGADTASGFEHLLREADRLVDQRARVQERVVATEHALRERAEHSHLRGPAQTRRHAAACAEEDASAAWTSLLKEAGLTPRPPAELRAWLTARHAVLAKHDAWQENEQELHRLVARRATALAALAAALPHRQFADDTLAAPLRDALAVQKSHLAARQTWQAAKEALIQATKDLARQQAALADAATSRNQRRATWNQHARRLRLPENADPARGRTALEIWDRIATAATARQTTLDRVQEMTGAIDDFAREAEAVAARVAPDQTTQPPTERVKILSARLQAAKATEQERSVLTQRITDAKHAHARHIASRDAAHAQITDLQTRAAVADEPGLRAAIADTHQARTLTADINRELQELRASADGKTEAELAADAAGTDFDTLPARIAEIDRAFAETNETIRATQEQITTLSRELADMERTHEAAAAEQSRQEALADIAAVVQRYPPLRMAETLLRAGIENFRRQQQDPLLKRAGALFAALTEGRYPTLDIGDDGQSVVARQADGNSCPADKLSEGTRDQLYLALRLAALEPDLTGTEPLPFIGDDLLVNFDDRRAQAALSVLAEFSTRTQVILFSHHDHIARMVTPGTAEIRRFAA